MGLSNGEANAVNALIRYFLGIRGHAGPVGDERTLEALLLLREKAYKTLSAGLLAGEVHDAFARHVADRPAIEALRITLEGECDTRREPERGARLDGLLDGLADDALETLYLAAHRLAENVTCAELRRGFCPMVIAERET